MRTATACLQIEEGLQNQVAGIPQDTVFQRHLEAAHA